jgi:hypothetical protein
MTATPGAVAAAGLHGNRPIAWVGRAPSPQYAGRGPGAPGLTLPAAIP